MQLEVEAPIVAAAAAVPAIPLATLLPPAPDAGASVFAEEDGLAGSNEVEVSQSNLIVNYLPSSLTPEEFVELFQAFGELERHKLVRDKVTGRSLCYGFVEFKLHGAAREARKLLDGTMLRNKRIKVSFAAGTNLYVAGIPLQWTEADLKALFDRFGTVTEAKVLRETRDMSQLGTSRGVGFVRFQLKGEAENAIVALNGTTQPGHDAGRHITVRYAERQAGQKTHQHQQHQQHQHQHQHQHQQRQHLYQQQQQPRWQQPQQYDYPRYGGPGMDHLRGTTFRSGAVAVAGVGAYAGSGAVGGAVDGAVAVDGGAAAAAGAAASHCQTGPFCLFVYNLPPAAQESHLYQLCAPFGATVSAMVIRDRATNLCKGYGFVSMTFYQDATNAIMSLNGSSFHGKILQVSFKQDRQS